MATPLIDLSKKIITLNEKQFLILRDYDERWRSFLLHEQYIEDLISVSEQFTRNPTKEKFQRMKSLVKEIEGLIVSSLRYLTDETKEGERLWSLVEEEKAADATALKVLETDILEIRRNTSNLSNGQVKYALIAFLTELNEEKDELQKEQKINEFLERILTKLSEIITQEKRILEAEMSLLQQTYYFEYKLFEEEGLENQRELKRAQLSSTKRTLEAFVDELRNLLEREKGNIINPYKAFTNQKAKAIQLILQRTKKGVITKEMIKEDLRKLNPTQAQAYLENLEYFRALAKNSARYYLRFKRFLGRKREKIMFKEADKLLADIELLKRKAKYDPLTGLGTKEFYETAIRERIKQTGHFGGIIVLAFLDLDYFKKINDTYGHHPGDIVLKSLGSILTEILDVGDIACRMGGEEFAIIFSPRKDESIAKEIAKSIQKNFPEKIKSKILIPFPGDKHISGLEELRNDLKEGIRAITMSVGVASMEIHVMEEEISLEKLGEIEASLRSKADEIMYKAKRAGRNKVFFTRVESSNNKKL